MNLKDLNQFAPPGWSGKYPPCQIQVDQSGGLFHNGAPIIHPGIRDLIFASVHLEDGVYFLELEGKRCQLEVSDTFWVVMRAELNGNAVQLTLNSGACYPLDPDSLWVGAGDVLYCKVNKSGHPARFSRPAYYQITQWIEESGDGYALFLNGREHRIKILAI